MKRVKVVQVDKIWEQKELLFVGILFLWLTFLSMMLLLGRTMEDGIVYSEKSATMDREKIVTTICVEKDSTLWDIATRYYTEDYGNLNDMIEEIKTSNGMESDTIHEGAYLIIPHYVNCETKDVFQ